MLPYWTLFGLTALPALAVSGIDRPRFVPWIALPLALIVTLLIGFRHEVGADWEPYILIFDDIRFMTLFDATGRTDPGYALFNWVAHRAGLDIWAVNLACATVFTAGLFYFVFRLPNPWLALAAATPYLIVVVAMGYTRQGVAIGCLMIALVAIQRESFFRFLFWLFIAATFHRSVIILLPLVGLAYTRNRILVFALGLIAAVAAYYIFVVSHIEALIANYTENDYESEGALIRILMSVVPSAIFLIYRKRFKIALSEYKMWRNFALASVATVPMFFTVNVTTVIDRFALYMIPLQIFVFSSLPGVVGTRDQSARVITFLILLYSGMVLFVWLNFATHAEYWLPYQIDPTWID